MPERMITVPCPDCGRPLAAKVAGGLCPACVLRLAESSLQGDGWPANGLAPEGAEQLIGRYKLLEVIGEGGFGTVWLAEQQEPVHRKVALKIIKLGMGTRQVVARFEAERQALALMDHPNIARVFDGGVTSSGRPFFVMEWVQGRIVTDYCDQHHLTTRGRIELFISVCQAVQHAHQKGVIHRDLKPSNILVAEKDERAIPKVIDFGVAKAIDEPLTDKTIFTRQHQFLGTPAYMSPEQAGAGGRDIDTRTDIYSLGVLLYELLTGQRPFETDRAHALDQEAILKSIREVDPPKPSTKLSSIGREELKTLAARRNEAPERLRATLSGDLDWIILKAIEKERERRYQSANGLAADLKRYLGNEPVSARPPSAGYRLRKSWQRNRVAYIAAGAVAAALVAALVISTRQRAELEMVARERRESLYASEMSMAYSAWQQGRVMQARELLDKQRPADSVPDLRGFDWRYLWGVTRPVEIATLPHAAYWGVATSPDGSLVAGAVGELALWDVANRSKIVTLSTNISWCHGLAFSPDGQWLAVPNAYNGARNGFELWDVPKRRRVHDLTVREQVFGVAFSPDSKTLITTGGRFHEAKVPGEVLLWDPRAGTNRVTIAGITSWVFHAAFSPDGSVFATSGGDGMVRIYDAETGSLRLELPRHDGEVFPVAFSHSGKFLATADEHGYVWVWDWAQRKADTLFRGHEEVIYALCFTTDDQRIVTASQDHTARLWQLSNRRELLRFTGHSAAVTDVKLLPDGQTLVTSSEDSTAKIWDLRKPRDETFLTHTADIAGVRFGAGGRLLFVVEWRPRKVRIFDCATRREIKAIPGQEAGSSPSGKHLVILRDNQVVFMDPATLNETGHLDLPSDLGGQITFSSNDRLVAFRRIEGEKVFETVSTHAVILDLERRAVIKELPTPDEGMGPLFFANNDEMLLSVRFTDKSTRIWETKSWTQLPQSFPPIPASSFLTVSVSADRKTFTSIPYTGTIRRWDLETLTELPSRRLTGSRVGSVDFSPDGKLLALGTDRGMISLFHIAAGQEIAALKAHTWYAGGALAFSPDGEYLASTGYDKTVCLWRAPTWNKITASESSLGRSLALGATAP